MPDDSGPKISMTRPRGRPPTPSARSSDRAPVWTDVDGHRALLAHPHDGPLAELLVDLGECHLERLVAIVPCRSSSCSVPACLSSIRVSMGPVVPTDAECSACASDPHRTADGMSTGVARDRARRSPGWPGRGTRAEAGRSTRQRAVSWPNSSFDHRVTRRRPAAPTSDAAATCRRRVAADDCSAAPDRSSSAAAAASQRRRLTPAAAASSAGVGRVHGQVERQPHRVGERIDDDRHQDATAISPSTNGSTGTSGTVMTKPMTMNKVSAPNVTMVLIVTAPSSKPSSRRHLMPHVRQRWWRRNHPRMKVRQLAAPRAPQRQRPRHLARERRTGDAPATSTETTAHVAVRRPRPHRPQ